MTDNLPTTTAPDLYPVVPSSTALAVAPPPLTYEAPSNWIKDVRGKKSKWVKILSWSDEDFKVNADEYGAEVQRALTECRAAIDELDASDECYVMRVEPEMIRSHCLESLHQVFVIRARVRWVDSAETANRCILFEQNFLDEFDGW